MKLLLHFGIDTKTFSRSCSLKPRDLTLVSTVDKQNLEENKFNQKIYDLLLDYERGIKPVLDDLDSDDEPKKINIVSPKKEQSKKAYKTKIRKE